MGKFGKYVTVPPDIQQNRSLEDVTDGSRYAEIGLTGSDLAILVHEDGAAISKSSAKKMYLMFVQCLNVPLRLRRPVWLLQSVWVGEFQPKNREAFLVELTQQMNVLQPYFNDYVPAQWTDQDRQNHISAVFIHSVLADSPERAAISDQLGHSESQRCLYCEQVFCCYLKIFFPT
jgi:hypothetical protein